MSLLVLLTCAAHQGHYPPRGPGSREKEVGTSTRLRMGASIAHPVNLQRPSSSTHRPPVPGWVVRSAPSATGHYLSWEPRWVHERAPTTYAHCHLYTPRNCARSFLNSSSTSP